MKKLLTKILVGMQPIDIIFLAIMIALGIVLIVSAVLITTFMR
jgi:heme/copper-type cytochrome/quinol oxidase subunit 2